MEESSRPLPDVNFYSWNDQIMNVSRSAQDILKIMVDAKENGSSVGVLSAALGSAFIVTAVDDIILDEDDTIIMLKPYDMAGSILSRNRLRLSEIEAACPLKSEFRNPVLKNIEKNRSWFF